MLTTKSTPTNPSLPAEGKKTDTGFNGWALYIAPDQKLHFHFQDHIVQGTLNIPNDTWPHVAVQRHGTQFKLYVNAALDDAGTLTFSGKVHDNAQSGVVNGERRPQSCRVTLQIDARGSC